MPVENSQQRTDGDVLKTIFRIEARGKVGTGFLIHDQQHILTALHVIDTIRAEKIIVLDVFTNTRYEATLQKEIPSWDVALLHLDKPLENVLPLHLFPHSIPNETPFRTYGFPNLISDGTRWYNGKIAGSTISKTYDFTFDALPPDSLNGLSGSPVFRSDDNTYSVVGIVTKQGPLSLQRGEIAPTAFFLDEISSCFIIEVPPEQTPWCYVLLSEAEAVTSRRYRLEAAVTEGLKILQKDEPSLEEKLKRIQFVSATTLVSSQNFYNEAVRNLCHARVVIFDVTHFEPAIMLFLGIRSVVRRGITIASQGGDSTLGETFNFPFNIKEVNIISHSQKQYNQARTPIDLISSEIQEGLRQLRDMPQYLDLPTFDAIRNLPPGSREPDALNILALCPYSKRYQEENWKLLLLYLKTDLRPYRDALIQRNMDVPSPLLISQTLYQSIRRKVLCLVDWTEWRPNVFFEFGVRLAITNKRKFTVTILENPYQQLMLDLAEYKKQQSTKLQNNDAAINEIILKYTRPSDDNQFDNDTSQTDITAITGNHQKRFFYIAEQAISLIKLFEPLVYRLSNDDQHDRSVFSKMVYYYTPDEIKDADSEKCGLSPYFTYNIIQELIDAAEESISTPVYTELYQTAKLFDVDTTEGRKAILYPENEALKQRVEKGITQRLLAAWYFIRNEYSNETIFKEKGLYDRASDISLALRDHIANDTSREDLLQQLDEFIEASTEEKGE